MSWLYLALLAPLLYAIINLLDDNLLKFVYKTPHAGAAISGLFGIVPALIVLILGLGGLSLPISMIFLSLFTGILFVVATFYYFKSLQKANPSVVAAILAITPILIPFFAYFIVGERLSLSSIIGFILLISCGFLYTVADTKKFQLSKALAPAIVAALIFDVIALTNKYIYEQVDFYSAYIYASFGAVVGGFIFLYLLSKNAKEFSITKSFKKNSKQLISLLLLVEALSTVAGYLFDRALSLGPVSLVTALTNMQPFYVLIIAVLLYPFRPQFFREAESQNLRYKFLLSGLIILGVFLLVQ